METALKRIIGSTVCDDLKRADLVIEAVNEDFDLKTKIDLQAARQDRQRRGDHGIERLVSLLV